MVSGHPHLPLPLVLKQFAKDEFHSRHRSDERAWESRDRNGRPERGVVVVAKVKMKVAAR